MFREYLGNIVLTGIIEHRTLLLGVYARDANEQLTFIWKRFPRDGRECECFPEKALRETKGWVIRNGRNSAPVPNLVEWILVPILCSEPVNTVRHIVSAQTCSYETRMHSWSSSEF